MADKHFHEEQFFNALRDIFVGAEIEGDSGFINLMRIKSRYYQDGVFPQLKQDIDAAVSDFPDFREELFDKLYTFFQRYFSESGSIYFRYTPLHQKVYEQVYTNEQDVVLFWKTHMLYYVKTDRIFKSLKVAVDGFDFFFDAANIEHKRANEKREVIFNLREVAQDRTLVFDCEYSTRGKITKNDEILRDLRKADIHLPDETLEKAFRVFEKQSEVDYFINKNAQAFLEEQFDLWMYQYLFADQNIWAAERLAQLQALKEIAYKVIGFISQFEDELVKIWNKPKFVRGSHYIITLDHVMEQEGMLEALFADAGMADQMEEWVDLGFLEEGLAPAELLRQVQETDLTGTAIHPLWAYLPVDTKHFPELELDILVNIDEFDEILDGWLIHSENYQALATIEHKYLKMVKCIYIDPPYNAEGSEIIYVNNYRSSSWLTLIENRIANMTKFLQQDEHAFVIAVDDYEMAKLVNYLEERFTDYDINVIVINHHPQGSPKANLSRTHEYAIMGTPRATDFVKVPRDEDKSDTRSFMRSGTGENNFRYGRPNSFYAFLVDPESGEIKGIEKPPEGDQYPRKPTQEGYLRVYAIDSQERERVWRNYYKTAKKRIKNNEIEGRIGRNGPVIFENVKITRVKPTSIWFDSKYNAGTHGTGLLTELFGEANTFSYPKSIFSVQDSIDSIVYDDEEAIALDFFAGSGTTAHAVMNLNREDGGQRKYILVEMGDHFHEVILPRIKKVAFCSKWKDGQPVFEEGESGMSQFVKYYSLESYEDVLQRVHYEDADLFDDPSQDPYHSYVFLRDRKLLAGVDVDHAGDKVRFHPERLYPDIDLAETLSHLKGKWIRRITEEYVEFDDGEQMSLTDPDWETLKPMVWWQ